MQAIWKFPLPGGAADQNGDRSVSMPEGARILSVAVQHNVSIVVWAVVSMDMTTMSPRRFRVIGTGWERDARDFDGTFLGTVQLFDGDLVFHVFEVT